MNIKCFEVDEQEAGVKACEYLEAAERSKENYYKQMAEVYEAVCANGSENTQIFDPIHAIRTAPRDLKGRPMLAVARADNRPQVIVKGWSWDSRLQILASDEHSYHHAWHTTINCLTLNFAIPDFQSPPTDIKGYALVPKIPAEVRNELDLRDTQLKDHFIFFEVDEWADQSHFKPVNPDPYLCKMIGTALEDLVTAIPQRARNPPSPSAART